MRPGTPEEPIEKTTETGGQQMIEIVLPVAADVDEPRFAQQRQMVAHGRLALSEALAKGTDVNLFLLDQ